MSPLHPVRSTAKKPQPRHGTPGARKTHPSPGQNHHTAGYGSAAESGPESTANPTRITARTGGPGHPDSGTGSAPANGKAAPQTGAARTQPTAKRKTLRTPRQPEHLPRPSPAPGSQAPAAQERQRQVLCSPVGIGSPARFRHLTSAGQERDPVALQFNGDIFGQRFVVRANV